MRKQYINRPYSKRFIDAFPKFKAETDENKTYFWEGWENSPFYDEELTEADLKKIYNHLLARYYNWHYVYLDDLGISLNTYHLISEYYPNVKERMKIVKELRELDETEFKKSGIRISSSGANPKIAKDMDELIDQIDSQNAEFSLKSKEQTLRAKFSSLYDGIMEEFIDRFKKLFVKLFIGVNSYVYRNNANEELEWNEEEGDEE